MQDLNLSDMLPLTQSWALGTLWEWRRGSVVPLSFRVSYDCSFCILAHVTTVNTWLCHSLKSESPSCWRIPLLQGVSKWAVRSSGPQDGWEGEGPRPYITSNYIRRKLFPFQFSFTSSNLKRNVLAGGLDLNTCIILIYLLPFLRTVSPPCHHFSASPAHWPPDPLLPASVPHWVASVSSFKLKFGYLITLKTSICNAGKIQTPHCGLQASVSHLPLWLHLPTASSSSLPSVYPSHKASLEMGSVSLSSWLALFHHSGLDSNVISERSSLNTGPRTHPTCSLPSHLSSLTLVCSQL